MNDGEHSGGFTPAPRPTGVRVAAAAVIAVLAFGFPVLLFVYGTAGDDTRSVVGSLMAVMVGATVLAWFYTRSRVKASADEDP